MLIQKLKNLSVKERIILTGLCIMAFFGGNYAGGRLSFQDHPQIVIGLYVVIFMTLVLLYAYMKRAEKA